MHSDEAAFLAAICANPDDDTARLVYADWLQENDRPERAEFIRAQIESIHCNSQIRWLELRQRQGALLNFDWCPVQIPRTSRRINTETFAIELLDGDGFRAAFEFRRGFVGTITLAGDDWLHHADELTASNPVDCVQLLSLTRWELYVPGNGYGRLPGRSKIASLGCLVGAQDATPLIRQLLKEEWPRITFVLPKTGVILNITREMLLNDTIGLAVIPPPLRAPAVIPGPPIKA